MLLAVVVGLSLLSGAPGPGEIGLMVANIAQALILGFPGNELRRWEPVHKGFKTADIVAARRFDDAEEKAIIRRVEHHDAGVAENSFPQGLHPQQEQSI